MKKVFLALVLAMLVCTGCEKVETGSYKEGTYMGYNIDGESVTTAVVYVDKNGMIKSCYIDTTYTKNDINTTKKVLGDDYGMKETSADKGNIPGGAEWYEQVKVIEDKVIAEQNLDWVKWQDENNTKLDAISGVTITADSYIKAIENALKQAK